MPAKTDVWIPIYIGDLLADTTHLSRADFGSYLLLIFLYWRRRQPLPDDDKALSEAARVALRGWPPVRAVLAQFFQIGDGVWRHKRIDRELAEAARLYEARRKGALATNRARRNAQEPLSAPQCDTPSPSPSQDKYIDIDIAEPTKAQARAARDPLLTSGVTNALNPPSSAQRLHGIPASVEEVIAYGQTINPKVSEEQCRAFWAHYEGQACTNENGDIFWVTSSDVVITNWKAKLPQFRFSQHETNRRTHKENPRNAGMPSPPDGGQRYADAFKRRSQRK